MTVIALTQEMGSLAKDVAEKLAADLGLQVMRHEVVDHVSSRLHVPTSLIHRLREGKAGALERLRADRGSLAVYMTEEVLDVAARGNVVLRGWGATCLLRPVRHVVSVRITRPFALRVQWVMDHLGTDDRELAETEVRRSDTAHAAKIQAQFGVTWGDPMLYDLVLNTERVSVDSCVAQIEQLAARPEFQETEGSRATLAGLALSTRVRAALKAHPHTRGVDVEVAARDGRVALKGLVVNEEERAQALRVAATVAGLGKVEDGLRTMAVRRHFTYEKT